MTIDLESYEAGNERRVRLCSGALVLHDGAVAVERDFSEFGSVVVEVSAQLSGLPRSGLAAALSLVVERSTDGSSWETVDTLTFSASGTVRTTDASPAVYLRVRASGTVGLWGVSADAIPLTAGGGGGGSQPSLPLDLGPGRFEVDVHGNTIISSDDPMTGDVLLLVSPVGNTAGLSIKTEGLDPCFQAGTDGSVDIRSGDGTTEGLVVFPNAAAAEYAAGLKVYKPNGADMGFRVFANGQVGIIDNAPIGDDNLALGELVISYDAATGTVHFKGMLADTSIKTATIVLT